MAPRGRPRKPRLTRMDAAVDAMLSFGFPGKLVRRRVNDLLKEYGGDEGWPFIEADAYKLLIDTILDEQEEEVNGEKCTEGENLMEDDSLKDERAGDCSAEADAGPQVEFLHLYALSLRILLQRLLKQKAGTVFCQLKEIEKGGKTFAWTKTAMRRIPLMPLAKMTMIDQQRNLTTILCNFLHPRCPPHSQPIISPS